MGSQKEKAPVLTFMVIDTLGDIVWTKNMDQGLINISIETDMKGNLKMTANMGQALITL